MSDPESRPLRRGPEWFLEKIEAGLPPDDAPTEAPPPGRRLSRAEIDDLVAETLHNELARLDDREAPEKTPD